MVHCPRFPFGRTRRGVRTGVFMRLIHMVLQLLVLPLPVVAQSAAGDPAAGRSTAMAMCTNCHFVGPDQGQPALDSVPSFDELARDPAVTEARLRSFITRP